MARRDSSVRDGKPFEAGIADSLARKLTFATNKFAIDRQKFLLFFGKFLFRC
ncbi:hypothetical protein MPC4_140091 [Methylocella tundrae]|uniref:Uncharacterized protein n=1 Tax=Methylocella tundrae TaxID=227605 RepID=A0A8B6M505_METTU|nr:hypothetical protein MPC4_140091 [Methylocella tundrae]